MGYLSDIKVLRNQMVSCNRDAEISIHFLKGDVVLLKWAVGNYWTYTRIYTVSLSVNQISFSNRIYMRLLHTAKADMENWSKCDA